MADIGRATEEAASVRKAGVAEADALAAALARAFYDDPQMVWVLTDDAARLDLLRRGFAVFLRKLYLDHDETYTTDSVAGACIWEPPGTWKVGAGDQLRLLPFMARIYGRLLPRVLRALMKLESNHPAEPHYYLPFVGVDPQWQGRGIGAALMRPMLERCDAEGVAAYLEASSPRNRMLYERHGFAVTEEFFLGPGSPPLWRMWRAPR
jgi:GNAT superfamily N-acetyltransferase